MYPPDEEQPTEFLQHVSPQAPVAPQAPLSSQQGTEVIANAGNSGAVGDDAARTQVLGAQPHFTAGPGQPLPPAEPRSNRNVVAIVAGAVLLVAAIVVGALLLMGGGDSQQASGDATATTVPAGSGSIGADDPTGDTAVDGSPGAATTAPDGGSGSGSGSGSSPGGSSTSTKPVFVTASLPSSYDCKAKSTFTVSWKTQNVVKVDVSVDGGYFGSYGPNDSAAVPANCSDTQAVKITAHGKDGSTVSKSVTAKDTSTTKDPKEPKDPKDPSGSKGSTDDSSTKSTPDGPDAP